MIFLNYQDSHNYEMNSFLFTVKGQFKEYTSFGFEKRVIISNRIGSKWDKGKNFFGYNK